MADDKTTAMLARQHADDHLGKASTALIRAADQIAEQYQIPDNINGLSRGEFLGRISFVISMQRDLRRAGVDLYANGLIRNQLKDMDPAPTPDDLDTTEVVAQATQEAETSHDPAMAVENIPGLTVQMVKALKTAGIHQLGDIDKFTDDALLNLNGIAGPSLAKIRASVAAVGARK